MPVWVMVTLGTFSVSASTVVACDAQSPTTRSGLKSCRWENPKP